MFLQEKKTALAKQQRRQLADLLSAGKETSAKIRVENIIREDIAVELMEFCELYCELLLARVLLILDLLRKEVDDGLCEAILLIVYCCGHTEIKELSTLGDLLRMRYGPEFVRKVLENTNFEYVPEKIVKRCDVMPPSEVLVDLYLVEIARTYRVPYSGLGEDDENLAMEENSDNADEGCGGGTQVEELEAPLTNGENTRVAGGKEVREKLAGSTRPSTAPKNDFEQLRARFAALKR